MSLHNLATQMAAQGRGPDRTLVHMSPREVQGLQALAMAHGGSLTINPETGLPEAGFLDNLLPAIAGFALNAFAPGVGTAVGSLFGLGGAAGTALTVGGIAGLASGSLEKGIMAGMGAYGGAGLGGSLGDMGSAVNARAANEAAQVAGLGDAERVAAIQAAAKPDISAGFSAAASAPKDFLKDNKMAFAAMAAPALMGGFGSSNNTNIPERKKYNMNYVKDPITGALYDTSGEGITYGGVPQSTRGMAEGGPVTRGGVPASKKVIDPYDTRTDSQKSLDYLMGVPGAKNPMLFTHKSTPAIKPADFATRKGGHYVLDAATNTYVWVPDDTTAANAAPKAGLDSLQDRGDGRGEDSPSGGGYSPNVSPMSNSINGSFGYQLADTYGNVLGGFLPGAFIAQAIAQSMNPEQIAIAGVQSAKALQDAIEGYTSGTMFGAPPSDPSTFGGAGYGTPTSEGGYGVTGMTGAGVAANPMGIDPATAKGQQADGSDGRGPNGGPEGGGQSPAGGGDGPGDGPGGECVDPKTHVLLADGSEVQAGALKVGDVVHTLHEDTFEYGNFEVVYAETIQQPKSIVKFTDGSEITTSLSHKFLLVDREWKRVDALKEGDAIETAPNVNAEGFKVVASLEQIGTGDVVKLTIDQAHTYISDGLVSHNKFARGGSVRQPNFYQNGKFNFHPAQVYANGGIAALAGGGLGSLGGYSDGGQLLRGPGDGVSDSIPARIAGKQPASLANNEFVIPARIVSELGNGSTDAGAKSLYKMMDRIQAGRKKSIGKGKIAVDSKAVKHLPA